MKIYRYSDNRYSFAMVAQRYNLSTGPMTKTVVGAEQKSYRARANSCRARAENLRARPN